MQTKKSIFNTIIKVLSLFWFIWYSYRSVVDYIDGKVVYNIINEYNPNLVFPSVTLCPKKKDELLYLDYDRLAIDYPHLRNHLTSYFAYAVMGNMSDPFEVIQNYSFNFEELEIRSRISARFSADGLFVAPKVYGEALENFTIAKATSKSYFGSPPYPISFTEINDFNGRCFNFQMKEIATLEPQFQGWTFFLSPKVEWNVYFGIPGVSYPTFTPVSRNILSFFTLQQNSQTYITFLANKFINLRRRGPLDSKNYCQERGDNADYIDCEKKCFLDTFNVSL